MHAIGVMDGQEEMEGYRLSAQQSRLWAGSGKLAVAQGAWLIVGELEGERLGRGLKRLVEKHQVLRTGFQQLPGMTVPLQVIMEGAKGVHQEQELELGAMQAGQAVETTVWEQLPGLLRQEAAASAAAGWGEGPLRTVLLKLSANRHLLVVTLAGLCGDAQTLDNLVESLGHCYAAEGKRAGAEGSETAVGAVVQYLQFSEWQHELLEAGDEAAVAGGEYWRRQLEAAGASSCVLPEQQRAERRGAESGLGCGRLRVEFDQETVVALRALAEASQTGLGECLFACWQLLVWRLTGAGEFSVGYLSRGRKYEELAAGLGLYARLLPVSCRLSGDETVGEVVAATGEAVRAAEEWEEYLSWEEAGTAVGKGPVLGLGFASEQRRAVGWGTELQLRRLHRETAPEAVGLQLTCVSEGAGLAAEFSCEGGRFTEAALARLAEQWLTLAGSAGRGGSSQGVGELEVLSAAQREQVVSEWNQTQRANAAWPCLPELIAAQAARTPEALAVSGLEQELSYRELNGRANQLAGQLREWGVGLESKVGILMERSAEMVVALLGVLKAGGAYVPVEVGEGPGRLRQMLREAEVAVVLTQERWRAMAAAATGEATSRPRILCLDSEWETVAGQGRENLPQAIDPDNLAYVIYTSGSSGRPKGALVTHEGLVNYLLWAVSAYELTATSGSLLHSALSFDLTVTSLYAPLLVGGCVELAAVGGGAVGLVTALRDESKRYGLVKLTPAHLEVLRQELRGRVGAKVEALVVGGEALYGESVGWWQEQAAELRVYNEYGPTETVVGCSVEEVAGGSRGAVGIGRAIANSWLYVLDERLRVVPIGVRGELYIGGAGVGRGYLGSPELTAERFVPDGQRGVAGSRLYRTGDVCRWNSEGRLQYLGRVDQQVKVRGYRVELGEVETVLLEEASVSEAVVVGLGRKAPGFESGSAGGPGELRLVAYVVNAAGVTVELEQLRRRLREQLPEYMIPELVVLGALPLTANGKVDRRALPAPEQVRSATLAEQYEAPRTLTEETLAAIWAEVLGVARVGINDNFFELGGDSILSIRIMSKASQKQIRLTAKHLNDYPTIAGLAGVALTTEEAIQNDAEQGEVTGMVPLTPIQRWFFAQQLETPEHWNQALLLAVSERLEAASLGRAVQALLAQHDALRLRFEREAGEWQQVNLSVAAVASGSNGAGAVPLSVHELAGLTEEEQRETVEREAARLQTTLHLSAGPLLRVAWFELGAGRGGRLLLVLHHLVVDGVSWRVLLEDLERGYRQAQQGEAISLGAKTSSYQRWAEQLQRAAGSAEVLAELPYWEEQLGRRGAEVVSLPVDYGGGENLERWARVESRRLSRAETRQLIQEVPAAYHTQITEVLLTALVGAVGEWCGDGRVVVDVEGHGREAVGSGVDGGDADGGLVHQHLSGAAGWSEPGVGRAVESGEGAGARDSAARSGLRAAAVAEPGGSGARADGGVSGSGGEFQLPWAVGPGVGGRECVEYRAGVGGSDARER